MKDQVAVVTGGAQGIGLAVARRLVEHGVKVASWDIDPGNADAMSGLGGDTLAIACDITDLASVEAAYARSCDTLGTPSILVNSAGIAGPNAPLESYGVDDWHRVDEGAGIWPHPECGIHCRQGRQSECRRLFSVESRGHRADEIARQGACGP